MEYLFDDIVFNTKTDTLLKKENFLQKKSGEISEYLIKLKFDGEVSPSTFRITFRENLIDEFGFFSSTAGGERKITPNWSKREECSRTASGMPMFTLFSKDDKNRLTVALLDASNATKLRVGVIEETGELEIYAEIFTELCPKMSEYETVLRIDRRDIDFSSVVKQTRSWWAENGAKSAYTPIYATKPMYSTWYSFHQDVIAENVLKECAEAKKLGMHSVIVDDGWQTGDNSRGYAYCGDWEVYEGKIPSMKKFVDDIHALGMKFLIWFSVPFVGIHSKVYEKFKGMYLSHNKGHDTAVLDPRFKVVREYLSDTYCDYVKKFGWDGLKLDFIDSFKLSENSSTDYDKMDCLSVEEGVNLLIKEVYEKVTAINPEFMIEFRQTYVGPMIGKYGNIFRVADCPYDSISNKIGAISLRLTSGTTAVHSDMIMWNKQDTVYSVAYQFLATLFAVPQISVKFDNISDEQRDFLQGYLAFWNKHENTLAKGDLTANGVDANFTIASSQTEKEKITAVYQQTVAKVDGKKVEYIFNATGIDGLYIECKDILKYEIYDVFSKLVGSGEISEKLTKLAVPNCGRIKLYK